MPSAENPAIYSSNPLPLEGPPVSSHSGERLFDQDVPPPDRSPLGLDSKLWSAIETGAPWQKHASRKVRSEEGKNLDILGKRIDLDNIP